MNQTQLHSQAASHPAVVPDLRDRIRELLKDVPVEGSDLGKDIERWQAEGRWVDRGRWVRLPWSAGLAYQPTRREIAAKCRLLRTRAGRHGAHARAPRGGEFAVATTAGI